MLCQLDQFLVHILISQRVFKPLMLTNFRFLSWFLMICFVYSIACFILPDFTITCQLCELKIYKKNSLSLYLGRVVLFFFWSKLAPDGLYLLVEAKLPMTSYPSGWCILISFILFVIVNCNLIIAYYCIIFFLVEASSRWSLPSGWREAPDNLIPFWLMHIN